MQGRISRIARGASLAVVAALIAWPGAALAQSAAGAGPDPNTQQPVPPQTGANAQVAGQAATAEAAPAQQQDIVVTGSRLATRGFSAPTPVTVLGAADIARQAVTNIADLLNTVPAFRAQSTPATTGIFAANAGANLADLRGFGANRTLVLIDGRRVVASTVSGSGFSSANSVDLNVVPTSLLARTEVVTGGASAAWGSDAVAGVVNLILDTKLTGLKASVQRGLAQQGDGIDTYATLAGGLAFADGRGHVVAGGEYEDNRGAGDCYTRSWCAAGYNAVTNPAPQTNGLARQVILPNSRTATSSFGGLITAGPLRGTEFASNGTTFQHDYGTYFATAPNFTNGGLFQSGGSADPVSGFYNNFPLIVPVRRYSTLAHASYDLTDTLHAFAEGSYAHVQSRYLALSARNPSNITIQRDNAFLPNDVVTRLAAAGATSFTFGRIFNDVGPFQANTRRETYRGVAGLSADLGHDWSVDGYYEYGRTNYHATNSGVQILSNFGRAIDAVRVTAANVGTSGLAINSVACRSTLTNPTNGCQPFNPFGAGNFSAAAKAYAFGTATQSTALTQQVASANAHGNLFALPGGPLALAFGGEYRVEDVNGTADPTSVALDFANSPGVPIGGPSIKVKEGYLELGAPLLAHVPFARQLTLNGGVRVTDYSTTGTVATWKVGGVWEPVSFLRLRATRSRDIRAPNFFELYSPTSFTYQSLTDPQRGGSSSLVPVTVGGNRNLKNEIAQTLTVGAVVTPVRNVNLSVDYFDIKLDGAIATLGGQVIVNECQQGITALCGQITRDATGAIATVLNLNLNLNRLVTRGIDIESSFTYRLGGGTASLHVLGTYLLELSTIDPTGITVDRSGMNGAPTSQPSGLPRFQGSATLSWSDQVVSATAQVRYVSSGVYNSTLIGPGQTGYAATLTNSVSDNHVGAVAYVNLSGSVAIWRAERGRRAELYGAINNLLDRDPPNDIPSSFNGTNPALYDVLGRTFRIGFRVSL